MKSNNRKKTFSHPVLTEAVGGAYEALVEADATTGEEVEDDGCEGHEDGHTTPLYGCAGEGGYAEDYAGEGVAHGGEIDDAELSHAGLKEEDAPCS